MPNARLRHIIRNDPQYIESWWIIAQGPHKATQVKSDNLSPVRLPVGLEAAICTAIARLPKREKP